MYTIQKLVEISDRDKRIEFAVANKKQLKKEKKAMIKTFAPVSVVYSVKSKSANKALTMELADNEFFVVGNSIGFFDSHYDVSMKGSWDKSVRERGNKIPIIKDHKMTVDNLFALNLGTSIEQIPIKELGYDMDGETDVVGAKIQIKDSDMLERYRDGRIKEHSVGMQYVELRLAVNEPEDEESYKIWVENIDKVINKEDAEKAGFFWAVYEQKLIEISAVVLGSNPFTPALKDNDGPQESTRKIEPLEDTQKKLDYSFLLDLR